MQGRKASYSCMALVGTNKAGVVKPDSNGYYKGMVVGAVGAFNRSGEFYTFESAKRIFDSSNSFMRRIEEGNCKGEMGHPKREPGMSMRDFISRVSRIEEQYVCCHFREIWLEEGHKDSEGRNIVAILADVKPSGPMGPSFKESMENPDENVCWSIRSLTNDTIASGGYVEKSLKNVITFDVVTEQGIKSAHKYNAPSLESAVGLESLESGILVPEYLDQIEEDYARAGLSMESAGISDIRHDLGWDKDLELRSNTPASANW